MVRPLKGVLGITDNIRLKALPISVNLSARIQDALTRQAIREARRIDITVDGSVVTLSGRVHSWAERNAAEGVTGSSPGVSRVVIMRQHHVGALVVVDAQDKTRPVGIVTDRDLVLELMAEGLDPAVFTAGDIMTVDLVTCTPIMDAMEAVLELLTRELADLTAGLTGARDREVVERL